MNISLLLDIAKHTGDKSIITPKLVNQLSENPDKHYYIPKICEVLDDWSFLPKDFRSHLTICQTDQVDEFPNLESISTLSIQRDSFFGLPKLEKAKTIAIESTKLRIIPELLEVDGFLDLDFSSIESLPKLKAVGGVLRLRGTPISNLESLYLLSYHADLVMTKNLITCPRLYMVLGNLNFIGSAIEELPNLTHVKGNAYFQETRIRNLDKLEYVGYSLDICDTSITRLPSLKKAQKIICGTEKQRELIIESLPENFDGKVTIK